MCSRFFLACLPSCYTAGSSTHHVYICPPLVDKTQAAGEHRGEER